MAFSLKISAYTDASKSPVFTIDRPFGWPANELTCDPRFAKSVHAGYLNYAAKLTIPEAQELYKKIRYSAMKIYGDVPASHSFRPNCIKLDDAICKESWMYDFFTYIFTNGKVVFDRSLITSGHALIPIVRLSLTSMFNK